MHWRALPEIEREIGKALEGLQRVQAADAVAAKPVGRRMTIVWRTVPRLRNERLSGGGWPHVRHKLFSILLELVNLVQSEACSVVQEFILQLLKPRQVSGVLF